MREADSQLKKHLEQMVHGIVMLSGGTIMSVAGTKSRFINCQDFVLDQVDWDNLPVPEPLTDEEDQILISATKMARSFHDIKFEQKECFWNAFWLSVYSDGLLTYNEGIAVGSVIPCMHGWVTTQSGKVIDLTWRITKKESTHLSIAHPFRNRIVGVFSPWRAYAGIKFDLDFMQQQKTAGGFIDDWQNGFPLLFDRERNNPLPDLSDIRTILGQT